MAQGTPLEKGAGSRTQAAGQTEERCQHDMPAVGGKGGGCRTTWQEGFAVRARAITARRWMDPGTPGRRTEKWWGCQSTTSLEYGASLAAGPPPLSCRFGCTPCGVGWDRVIMGHAAGTGRDPAARPRAIGSIIGWVHCTQGIRRSCSAGDGEAAHGGVACTRFRTFAAQIVC